MTTHFTINNFKPIPQTSDWQSDLLLMLQQTELFIDFTIEELQEILPYGDVYHVDKNTIVIDEGRDSGYMCLLLKGSVDIYKKTSVANKTIARIEQGKTLGEMSIIDELPFSATGIATEQCILLLYSRSALDQIAKNHADLCLRIFWKLSKTMSSRLRKTTDMLGACLSCTSELTMALNDALHCKKSQNDLLAEMSHELRTPLHAILGYTELLQEKATDMGHDEYITDAQVIHNVGTELLDLINNLLNLSKIQAGKMQVHNEDFKLELLLQKIATIIKPLLNKNQNQFYFNIAPTLDKITTDMTKLRQCLINLLSNACKFTKNGEIYLTITENQINDTKWIIFEVKDTGKGMSFKQIQQLFHAYTQTDSSIAKNYGGTGLGLALTYSYIKLLGGHIEVNSNINQGSTFVLHLPQVPVFKSFN